MTKTHVLCSQALKELFKSHAEIVQIVVRLPKAEAILRVQYNHYQGYLSVKSRRLFDLSNEKQRAKMHG